MTEAIIVIVALAWSAMMYVIGQENGEAKAINRDNKKPDTEIKHFDRTHFTGITIGGRKFLYCPVGNIISWSEGDHDNKWCHYEQKYFEEIARS